MEQLGRFGGIQCRASNNRPEAPEGFCVQCPGTREPREGRTMGEE
jgi:hypothetical protein